MGVVAVVDGVAVVVTGAVVAVVADAVVVGSGGVDIVVINVWLVVDELAGRVVIDMIGVILGDKLVEVVDVDPLVDT